MTDYRNRGLGLRRDLPDIRDNIMSLMTRGVIKRKKPLPNSVDLRPQCPSITDQGSLGSCTGQAVTALCDFLIPSDKRFLPSALFTYYCTREIEGTVNADAGASLRNSIKSVNQYGMAGEKDWPYIISKFNKKPVKSAYDTAENYQALQYERVRQDLNDMMYLLADGFPFVLGISVYESFYQFSKLAPLPLPTESLLGGHAIMAVGYDLLEKVFIIRNSWGVEWGDKGYFYLPFSYISDHSLAMDFWTVKIMEDGILL